VGHIGQHDPGFLRAKRVLATQMKPEASRLVRANFDFCGSTAMALIFVSATQAQSAGLLDN
jgi:hypothetical protein